MYKNTHFIKKNWGDTVDTQIAVICSNEFAKRVKTIETELSSIKLQYYTYRNPQEATALIGQIKPCDAVFFSGSLPYFYAKKKCDELPIPTHYLKQDGTAIATTLLALTNRGTTLQEVSIDITDPNIATGILEDISTNEFPWMYKIEPNVDIEEIVKFHYDLYQNQKTTQAVTSIHAVYEILQKQNVPVIRMIDPRSSIIKGISETKNLAILSKSQSAKIAVGYIQFESNREIQNNELGQFTLLFKTRLIEVERNLFTLFTTQGDVQRIFEYLSEIQWKRLSDTPFKLAFGYGSNIEEATQNAKDALLLTKSNTAYVLTEHKQLLGPYPKYHRCIELRTQEPVLVEVAKSTSLSPANLSKVIQFSKYHTANEFTAHDLESFLQVSRRTSERILKKLVDHQYAEVVGEEMTYQQGRPRAVYRLNFPTYL